MAGVHTLARTFAAVGGIAALAGCYQGLDADLGDAAGAAATEGASTAGEDPPDEPGPAVGSCDPESVQASRLRRLNRREYLNTVRDVFELESTGDIELSLPRDPLGGHGLDTNGETLILDPADAALYFDAADEVAAAVRGSGLSAFAGCADQQGQALRDCADYRLEPWLFRAFRRPVEATTAQLLRDQLQSVQTYDELTDTIVGFTLTSPSFLFHYKSAVAASGPYADGFERADRLASLLWSSSPDEPLLGAAASGELDGVEGLRSAVDRMLDDPRSERFYEDFSALWLRLGKIDLRPEAAESPELYASMKAETTRFFRDVLEAEGPISALLDSDYSLVDGHLAELYGLPDAPEDAWDAVDLPADQRSGLLTHASVLAASAGPDFSDPIRRGSWVANQIMCEEPPPPPPGVPPLPPVDSAGGSTIRELLEEHRADPACASCHKLIDPYGLALENYDMHGVYRETYPDGAPIDASGELVDGRRFKDAIELSHLIAESEKFETCFASYVSSYAIGRTLTEDERCFVELAVDQARRKDGTFGLRDLLVALVGNHLFVATGEDA